MRRRNCQKKVKLTKTSELRDRLIRFINDGKTCVTFSTNRYASHEGGYNSIRQIIKRNGFTQLKLSGDKKNRQVYVINTLLVKVAE